MALYQSKTILKLIQEIEKGKVVLPAMQRNFVWSEEKICNLFESIMNDYPIGTFLFWNVDKDVFSNYSFNCFVRDYDEEQGDIQRGKKVTTELSEYTAVLDGQQRITSFYIGVKGKLHTHIKGKKRNRSGSYEDRYLCIDVLYEPRNDDEEECRYRFAFMPQEKIGQYVIGETGHYEYWIRVSKVYEEDDTASIVEDMPVNEDALPHDKRAIIRKEILVKLYNGLRQNLNVNYYLAEDRTLADVVDIFVRVNSGGEVLGPSDLMLSVATGELGNVDVHKLIDNAVQKINHLSDDEKRFKCDKEMILTAGLMFVEADSLSLKASNNYKPARMNQIFKENWEAINKALICAVDYVEYLGFVGNKISKNIILVIAYYFFINHLSLNHKRSSTHRAYCDRVFIRQWILRTMINGVFSEGTGKALLQIGKIIKNSPNAYFPLDRLMDAEIKKPLTIDDEQIDDILDFRYGDSRIIPLFNELEHRKARENVEVDHIWCKQILSDKRSIRKLYPLITDKDIKRYKDQLNKLPNLQLLDGEDNRDKWEKPFDVWLKQRYKNERDLDLYRRLNFIPDNVPYNFENFLEFIAEREALLRAEIKLAFPSDFGKIVERYGLQENI